LSGQKQLLVGKISGAFGIKGWVKIFSFTDPKDNILNYSPWILIIKGDSKFVKVINGKMQGKHVVAQLEGLLDRDQAEELASSDIAITADQLPVAEDGTYYWSDLIGLKVNNLQGVFFGEVASVMETGANDVLVVKGDRERAIPFLQGQSIVSIDVAAGVMVVDWDPDF
jgi:16S rRNA processing protein RimM